MFSISKFTLVTVLASVLVARAQVDPSEPSPGSVYPEGGPCPIAWGGDPKSAGTWKNMNIELMTGDNFNMVHITTVATGQDGTVDGKFTYTCPQVTLNSAVYFYQFTNNQTSDKTWTGRFAISTATGATTPPPNATQPGNGENIPWGVGALEDPSQAVPAPGPGGASAVASQPSSSGILIASSSSAPSLPSAASVTPPVAIQPPSSTSTGAVAPAIAAPSNTSSTTATGSSGAIALSATPVIISLIAPVLALMFV